MTLTIDGAEQVLPIGEPQQVELDGRPYLAEAFYARSDTTCGVIGGGGVSGSAYLAPLAE